jgi:hypothetical protein
MQDMSIVRLGEDKSQVYIYRDIDLDGGYVCDICGLIPHGSPSTFHAKNDAEMFDHLKAHIDADYRVPSWVLDYFSPDDPE